MLAARRETLSIYNELRALAWIGVMLIATGTGIFLSKHLDDIGPVTIAIVIGSAAIGCYAWAVWRQSEVTEYIVLLGALLISADVGYIEHQWHILGPDWQRHFLFLSIAHAAAAYFFGSRAVLSLSISALAVWFRIEGTPQTQIEYAIRFFACAGVVGLWRIANPTRLFNEVFEHFAANLAFWGALILTFDRDTRAGGAAFTVALAITSVVYGFRKRREMFVIYGYVYGLIAVDAFMADLIHDHIFIMFFFLCSTVIVIVAMVVTHLRFRR